MYNFPEDERYILRAEITFVNYVNCDADILTLQLCTINVLIETKF